MDEKLTKDVEVLVAEIFSQKEEASKIKKTEGALQKSAETIAELTAALEDKNSKEETMVTELDDLKSKTDDLTSELEAAQRKVEESDNKLVESENLIEEMKKDKAAEVRMSELEQAGVALSDKETQTAKIREMDDEVFVSYKKELVSLRKAVETELARADESPNSETETEEVPEAAEEVQETETEEDLEEDEAVPPVNVDPDTAVAAAMNLEIAPSDGLMTKYSKLGKAMAERMTD